MDIDGNVEGSCIDGTQPIDGWKRKSQGILLDRESEGGCLG